MIQIRLHPEPLLLKTLVLPHPQESLHPQLVAVKSLIVFASKGFIYALFYAPPPVYVSTGEKETFVLYSLFRRAM